MKNKSLSSFSLFFISSLIVFTGYFLFNGLSHRIPSFDRIVGLLEWYESSILIFFVTIITSYFFYIKFKYNLYFIFFLFLLCIQIITGNILTSILYPIFTISCISIGLLVFKFYKVSFGQNNLLNKYILSILLGIPVFSILISLFNFFPINNIYFYTILLVLPILPLCYFGLHKKFYLDAKDFFKLILVSKNSISDILIISLLNLYFFVGLMPENGTDALATHLFIPTYIDNFGLWDFDVNSYIFASFPIAPDLFNSFVYVIGGEYAARFTLFYFLILSLFLMNLIFSHLKISNKNIFNILYLSTPIVYLEASSLYVEMFWLFVFISILYLLIFLYKRNNIDTKFYFSFFVLLSAFFINSKAISLIYLSCLLIFLLLFYFKEIRKYLSLEQINLINTFIILWGLSSFIIAYIYTGNPVFPFFNKIFQSPLLEPTNWTNYLFVLKIKPTFLYDITFHTNKFLESTYGGAGFFWLVFLLPMTYILFIIKNKNINICFLYLIVTTALIFNNQVYLRYIFPSIFLFYLIFFYILARPNLLSISLKNFFIALMYMVIILNIIHFNSATNYGQIKLDAIFGNRSDYIKKYIPQRHLGYLYNTNHFDSTVEHPKDQINILNLVGASNAFLKAKPLVTSWHSPSYGREFVDSLSSYDNFQSFIDRYKLHHILSSDAEIVSLLNKYATESEFDYKYNLFYSSTILQESVSNLELREIALSENGAHE